MRLKLTFILLLCMGVISAINLYAFPPQQETVEPVNWRELIPFLIDIPGFEKEGEPDGESVSMMNYKWSKVSQYYVAEGDGDKKLTLEIVDSAMVSMALQGFKAMMGMEVDTSEESIKQININGYPALEIYRYHSKSAELNILIENRFLVRLEGDDFEDTSQLKNISKNIDLKGIADLAK
ncbi:MAG: hypothetical protein ACLFVG_10805 [Candidatus Aminicenantes bacterium]